MSHFLLNKTFHWGCAAVLVPTQVAMIASITTIFGMDISKNVIIFLRFFVDKNNEDCFLIHII